MISVLLKQVLPVEYIAKVKEKKMANKKMFWLGILVMVLVFGMAVVGCDGESGLTPEEEEAKQEMLADYNASDAEGKARQEALFIELGLPPNPNTWSNADWIKLFEFFKEGGLDDPGGCGGGLECGCQPHDGTYMCECGDNDGSTPCTGGTFYKFIVSGLDQGDWDEHGNNFDGYNSVYDTVNTIGVEGFNQFWNALTEDDNKLSEGTGLPLSQISAILGSGITAADSGATKEDILAKLQSQGWVIFGTTEGLTQGDVVNIVAIRKE